ncbi:glycosyltransferase family 4 protein [Desulfococcaceae bacterium HSG9]|nr:glycosyltransferase family 4 protein [Desulfococcaceae bacterium HSG9]
MKPNLLKVLFIIEQCNPEWASVPLVGYNFYRGIRKRADVTLVTHIRNKAALEKVRNGHRICYIEESHRIRRYYRLVSKLTTRGGVNWPLQHALSYPIYAEFNNRVFRKFKARVLNQEFDLVHALTPMLPRYPYKIINACKNTPFLLGPVNGGVPFPDGFKEVAKMEFAHFNFLRIFTRMLPGYAKTYKTADRVLSGSTYTLNMLKNMFNLKADRIELFYENGIEKDFIQKPRQIAKESLDLLFVGRLVPYKGADMVIEALGRLPDAVLKHIRLTIVGDGSERNALERQTLKLGLNDHIRFTGWIEQKETADFYKNSDLFCFPSVREFGGAVALEAMACGLPCIVADHAGIGEYVTSETGFKIKPESKEFVIQKLSEKIQILFNDDPLRLKMAKKAVERAMEFEWERKAEKMTELYDSIVTVKRV